jgi:hypothetical protein
MEFLKEYNGIFQLISITFIPIIVVFISIWYQNRQIRQKAKMDLFLKLMAHRRLSPITQQWVDSLNTIDVVFQNDKKVQLSWRAYYESLHETDPKNQNNETYLIEMLSEIAKSLGYNHLTPSRISDFYTPVQFGNTLKAQNEVQEEFLRVLKNSTNLGIKIPQGDVGGSESP